MRCPQCQQEDWVPGEMNLGGRGGIAFKAERSKTFVVSYPAVKAQACRICGYVVLATDVEKLKSTLKS